MQIRTSLFFAVITSTLSISILNAQQQQFFSKPYKGDKIVSVDTIVIRTKAQAAVYRDSIKKQEALIFVP